MQPEIKTYIIIILALSVFLLASCTNNEAKGKTDNNENGIIADYFYFDNDSKEFGDYVSSEVVSVPLYNKSRNSGKFDKLGTVGVVSGRGIRYSAKIRFPQNGIYTLSAQSNLGVHIILDGNEIISNWHNTNLDMINGTSVKIEDDSLHDIVIDTYNMTEGAFFSLYWANNRDNQLELIPKEYFYLPEQVPVVEDVIFANETVKLKGSHLDYIEAVSVVPYSLSSVKKSVSCDINSANPSLASANPNENLKSGTYRVVYESRGKYYKTEKSFYIGLKPEEGIHRVEHPQPDAYRDNWLSLNGQWTFEFDPDDIGESERWYDSKTFSRIINVPFAWQSDASGIGNDTYHGRAWYKKKIDIDNSWLTNNRHCFLCFGAVDAEAIVYVNGEKAGAHFGGYTPFEIDVTKYVIPGKNDITVEVFDEGKYRNDSYSVILGKQGYEAPCGYTATSGIWQSVYMECRPDTYIEDIQINTEGVDYITSEGSVSFNSSIFGNSEKDIDLHFHFESILWDPGTKVDKVTGKTIDFYDHKHILEGRNRILSVVDLHDAYLWSALHPNLYCGYVEIISTDKKPIKIDKIETYFGIRKIETKNWNDRDYQYICVNGNPVFLSGVLDQGFWVDGGYTAPSEEALYDDIAFLKSNGFNMIRKHLKIEDPLQYYWCDKLGIYVMQDMPYASGMNAMVANGEAPGRQLYESTLTELLHRDYNHPSLISIQLFNETWGIEKPGLVAADGMTTLDWQKSLYQKVKNIDNMILVEDMSPNKEDHIQPTDINSFHSYTKTYGDSAKRYDYYDNGTSSGMQLNFRNGYLQEQEPWMNSEYGGVCAHDGDYDVSYCFKYETDLLRQHEKLNGFVYTEPYDIEYERNGLRTYDRKEKVFGYSEIAYGDDMSIKDLVQPEYIGFNMNPVIKKGAGEKLNAEVIGINWSEKDYDNVTLKWILEETDTLGKYYVQASGEDSFSYSRYEKNSKVLSISLPTQSGICTLTAWIEKDGRKIAKNFTYIIVEGNDGRPIDENEIVLKGKLDKKSVEASGELNIDFGAYLSNSDIDLINGTRITGARLIMELSSVKGYRKVNGILHSKYSQTTRGDELPSTVYIYINDVMIDEVRLRDDYRDMRGVLSLLSNINGGSSAGDFGDLIVLNLSSTQIKEVFRDKEKELKIKLVVSDECPNGIRIYDKSNGRYMVDPAIVIERG